MFLQMGRLTGPLLVGLLWFAMIPPRPSFIPPRPGDEGVVVAALPDASWPSVTMRFPLSNLRDLRAVLTGLFGQSPPSR